MQAGSANLEKEVKWVSCMESEIKSVGTETEKKIRLCSAESSAIPTSILQISKPGTFPASTKASSTDMVYNLASFWRVSSRLTVKQLVPRTSVFMGQQTVTR